MVRRDRGAFVGQRSGGSNGSSKDRNNNGLSQASLWLQRLFRTPATALPSRTSASRSNRGTYNSFNTQQQPTTSSSRKTSKAISTVSLDAKQKPNKNSRSVRSFGSRVTMHSFLFQPHSGSTSTGTALLSTSTQQRKSFSVQDLQGGGGGDTALLECHLCFHQKEAQCFPRISVCSHTSCYACWIQYLRLAIAESRVQVPCPECDAILLPSDIRNLLVDHPHLVRKWEDFTLRRTLMVDPDIRWCPAPDCNYAVVAAGCASCPMLRCERPGCDTSFCYHCKQLWHDRQTCDEARAQRGVAQSMLIASASSAIHAESPIRPGDVKACPRCRTLIVKMQDGSCNHMVCAICGSEFCWLCMREITDLHYLSPSGCTFWGKKQWSRKKKLVWQLGILVGAPAGIGLLAGLAVPAILFGVPVWVGRKVHQRMRRSRPGRRHCATVSGVAATLMLSPVLACLAVGVGVPMLLAYVYIVVPLSVCRNDASLCGLRPSSLTRLEDMDDSLTMTGFFDGSAASRSTEPTERLGSASAASTSTHHHRLQVQADIVPPATGKRRFSIDSGAPSLAGNYEAGSTKGLAGSTYRYGDDKSVGTDTCIIIDDEHASTRGTAEPNRLASTPHGGGGSGVDSEATSLKALAGSLCDTKSLHQHQVQLDQANNPDDASTMSLAGSLVYDTKSVKSVRSAKSSNAVVLEQPSFHPDPPSQIRNHGASRHSVSSTTTTASQSHRSNSFALRTVRYAPTDTLSSDDETTNSGGRLLPTTHVETSKPLLRPPILQTQHSDAESASGLPSQDTEEAELLSNHSSATSSICSSALANHPRVVLRSHSHSAASPGSSTSSLRLPFGRMYAVPASMMPAHARTSAHLDSIDEERLVFVQRSQRRHDGADGDSMRPSSSWLVPLRSANRRNGGSYASLPDVDSARDFFSYSVSRLTSMFRK